jgi:hypothetical protein
VIRSSPGTELYHIRIRRFVVSTLRDAPSSLRGLTIEVYASAVQIKKAAFGVGSYAIGHSRNLPCSIALLVDC